MQAQRSEGVKIEYLNSLYGLNYYVDSQKIE